MPLLFTLFTFCNLIKTTGFEVYTARALNNHIAHRITAEFIMKTTREAFTIMHESGEKLTKEKLQKNHNFVNL